MNVAQSHERRPQRAKYTYESMQLSRMRMALLEKRRVVKQDEKRIKPVRSLGALTFHPGRRNLSSSSKH